MIQQKNPQSLQETNKITGASVLRQTGGEKTFTLYTTVTTGDATNCRYPHKAVVTDAETLKSAVGRDYVAALYDGSYRRRDGFIRSDCLAMDCDNDHSDNPSDWVTPDDIAVCFPDVAFGIHYSRNHLKEKHGQSPRPRFHVLFPIEPVTDPELYAALKARVLELFPFFDRQAADAARFFFGTAEAHTEYRSGTMSLSAFLKEHEAAARSHSSGTIPAGQRNTTLSHFSAKVLKRYGPGARAYALFRQEAARCDPPLDDSEVAAVWRSSLKFYQKKVLHQESYIPPEDYEVRHTPGDLKPGDYTDLGQAKIFAAAYEHELLYTDSTDYLRYNGGYWEEGRQSAVRAAEEFLDLQLADAEDCVKAAEDRLKSLGVSEEDLAEGVKKLNKLFDRSAFPAVSRESFFNACKAFDDAVSYRAFAIKERSIAAITAMLQAAKPMLEIRLDMLDADGFLLNTPGSTIDLRSGSESGRSPVYSDYITKQTLCSPGDKGEDIWQNALDTLFCGDAALKEYVQQIVGLAAIGKIYQEALIIAYGDGRNGKSTFWNTISRVLGRYSGTFSADALTAGCRRNVRPEMAELKGKRLIIAAELEEGMRLNTSVIKQLCSTDDITAEKKFKDPFRFTPSHTLVLYTNHLPHVSATDDGTWRRLIVIPFQAKIAGTSDILNYSDYLVQEAGPAIMRWITEGARKVISVNCKPALPACVIQAISAYRETNDWLSEFLKECCETGTGLREKSGELYQTYRMYCARTGEYARRTQDFIAALELAGFTRKKTSQCNYIVGLKLFDDTGFKTETNI